MKDNQSLMNTYRPFIAFMLAMIALSCVKPPDYPREPYIEYVGMNKLVIAQGNLNSPPDTLEVYFSFTDGDGDIGLPEDSTNVFDAFLTDSRDGFTHTFRLPVIPEQGTGNGISGEITLRLPNRLPLCCTFPDGSTACLRNERFPTDTMSFIVQMRDRAGNFSNKARTETFTILCR
jgi:hypothetical protein